MRSTLTALVALLAVTFLGGSTPASADGIFPPGSTGLDISWPSCGLPLPAARPPFAIIGATGGKAFTQNPCLATQYVWAARGGIIPSLYVNLKSPVGSNADQALVGPRGACAAVDQACLAYNFGYNTAKHAVAYAASQRAPAASWWLDVETESSWSDDVSMNAIVIAAAIDYLQAQGAVVGIYSTQSQWREIAGGYMPGLPVWVAMAPTAASAPTYCTRAFGGGQVWLVQYLSGFDDIDYACTPADRVAPVASPPLGPAGSTATVAGGIDCLNVRSQAGFAGGTTACLPSGTQVTLQDGVVAADGYRWVLVAAGSVRGWVADTFLNVPVAVTHTAKIESGSVPAAGGFGLFVFGGGTTEQLVAASGCPAATSAFWASDASGGFDVYVPGARIASVNAAWNARFAPAVPPGTALLGRCR